MDKLTIGQVATHAGVHKETIRYYQALGLVPEPQRPPGSVRRYGFETVARLRFIKRAQQLGFTLQEVGKLLMLETARAAPPRGRSPSRNCRSSGNESWTSTACAVCSRA